MEHKDLPKIEAVWNLSCNENKKGLLPQIRGESCELVRQVTVKKPDDEKSRVIQHEHMTSDFRHKDENVTSRDAKSNFQRQKNKNGNQISQDTNSNYHRQGRKNYTQKFMNANRKVEINGKSKQNDKTHKGTRSYTNTIPLSFHTLQDLSQKSPNEILVKITSNLKNGFMLILDEKDIGIDKMAYILIILGKSCLSEMRKNVGALLTNVCSKSEFFLTCIQKYLVSLRLGSVQSLHLESLSCLTTFLHFFQSTLPSSASEIISILLPLLKLTCEKFLCGDDLYIQVITKLTEIDDANEHHIKSYSTAEVKKASKKEKLHLLEPPENYRTIPVLPTADDIHSPSQFLRPNIVKGSYNDTEHYLDVQYRLMREDYVKPLRDGISEYLRLKKAGKSFKNCKDVRIYTNVHIVKQDFVNGGMVHIADFSNEAFSRIRWEYSKRFLSGSLLCFSSDDFETMLFAAVAQRLPEQLRKGLLLIRFENITEEVLNLSPLRSFVVIETTAYFEAYRYNLKALHELNGEILPFKKYIVHAEKTVDNPQYLTDNAVFDMRPLFIPLDEKFFKFSLSSDGSNVLQYEFPPDISNIAQAIPILNDEAWPTEKDLNLDHSQYLALKAALTREFAIIQGPPGTGKTYIGLRIVQLLLHNIEKWWMKNENFLPILVVCYTNHALDQFLEGLMLFSNKIVRIGGRGNNEAVSQFQISNLRKNAITKREIPKHISAGIWHKNNELRSLKSEIDKIQSSVQKSFTIVLGECELQPFMPNTHFQSLKMIKTDPLFRQQNLRDDGYLIHDWLGIRSRIGTFEEISNAVEEIPTQITQEIDINSLEIIDDNLEDEGEADIEFIEAQRDINADEYAGVSFDIDVPEEKDDLILYGGNSEWKVQGGHKKLKKLIKKKIKLSQAFEEVQANNIRNIWHLDFRHRWCLYKFWLAKYIDGKQKECFELQSQLKKLYQEVSEIRTEEDIFVLQNAHIVGMTTTGAAKYRDIVVRLNPQILIVEEAAEILESHTVTSLAPKTQHVILIGDHQQLRPSPTVHMLSVQFDLDISLFERMIKNDMDCFKLSVQHRMRPDIADLIVPHIYNDLKNHESVMNFENIKGVSKNMYFVTHNFNELQETDSKSKINEHEARFLIELCKYLIRQGYDSSQITILTTYSGQLFVLKKLVTDMIRKVRITVVDNFQGEENDIILLSFVRSNDEGEIGFLKTSNRVCVALSRARKGLYCIGNFELLSEKSELWKNIVKTLQEKQCIGTSLQLMCQNHPGVCNIVANETDFESVPEGGCTRLCEYRLSCGHTCSMMCHPYDMEHEHVRCQKPCTKTCSDGHQCKKKCFQVCGDCTYLLDKKMYNCGHSIKVKCCMKNEEILCNMRCDKKLSCGHACKNQCSETCTFICKEIISVKSPICGHDVLTECCDKNDVDILIQKCNEPCKVVLECGHVCKGTCRNCHQSRLHVMCGELCKRILVCGHECKSSCSKSCPPCKQPCENRCVHSKCPKKCGEPCDECTENCQWYCKHQQCSRRCGELCNRIPCNEPCSELLQCKHACIGFCGEPCPVECRECNEDIVKEIFFGTEDEENARFICLEDCGHILEISGLTQWMQNNTEGNQIQMKSCPKCKTVIRTNFRFGNIVKSCLKKIEKVKQKTFGNKTQNKKYQAKLLNEVNDVYKSGVTSNPKYLTIFNTWKNLLSSKRCRSLQEFTTFENIFNTFLDLIDAVNKLNTDYSNFTLQNAFVKDKLEVLLHYMTDSKKWMVEFIEDEYLQASEQQLKQLTWEVHRLKLGMKILKYVKEHRIPESNSDFQDMIDLLTKYSPFGENDVKAFIASFQKLTSISSAVINVTEMEKISILKAMNLTKGHWYQCPNGHVYCITECGGATQVGRCNECNASIGGTNHSLLSSNRVATDMDGSVHGAWSDVNNLLNYGNMDPFF